MIYRCDKSLTFMLKKGILFIGLMTLCMFLSGCQSGTAMSNKAAEGDVVKIDFVGKLDGEAFSGGSATDYILEIGSGMFIDGFEEQLVGMKDDETRTITVTFPEDYGSEELNGKECTFDVTVKDLYKKYGNEK